MRLSEGIFTQVLENRLMAQYTSVRKPLQVRSGLKEWIGVGWLLLLFYWH